MSQALPKITVIVPTRQRAHTLGDTLRSCVEQPEHDGYEILVSDNQSTDGTRELVEAINDPRIRYVRTPEFFSMEMSWDFALSHVESGYVVYMGADDALFPGAITMLQQVILETGAEAVRPLSADYDWDNFPVENTHQIARDYSIAPLKITWVKSAESLQHIANNLLAHQQVISELMPNVYHGCVHVDALRRHAKGNHVFQSKIPDFWSAIWVAASTEKYVLINRPATLIARSCSSNAVKQWYGDTKGDAESRHFWEQVDHPYEPELVKDSADPDITPALPLLIADQYLKVKKLGLPIPEISMPGLLKAIVKGAGRWADQRNYDSAIRTARNFASIQGLEKEAEELIRATPCRPRVTRRPTTYFDTAKQMYRVIDLKSFGATGGFSATVILTSLKKIHEEQREIRARLGLPDRPVAPKSLDECLWSLLAMTAAPHLSGTACLPVTNAGAATRQRLLSPPSRVTKLVGSPAEADGAPVALLAISESNLSSAGDCASVFLLASAETDASKPPAPGFLLSATLPVMVVAEEQMLIALHRWEQRLPGAGLKRRALDSLLRPIKAVLSRHLHHERDHLWHSGWVVQHWTRP